MFNTIISSPLAAQGPEGNLPEAGANLNILSRPFIVSNFAI
jgi:hypothetical protein